MIETTSNCGISFVVWDFGVPEFAVDDRPRTAPNPMGSVRANTATEMSRVLRRKLRDAPAR